MKTILLFALLSLTSCTKIYQEVYLVERYPMEWEEEIIISAEHQHLIVDNEPKCIYWEADTICWHHRDTAVVMKLESRTRIK